jgi:hypothetical protein
MIIKEFRIPLPLTVEEYQVAQLYSVSKMSVQETSGQEGVEIVKNEPYENSEGKGQYTYKLYHLGNKMPGWIAAILPKDLKVLHEEAWNAYPICKTVITSPYFGDKFLIQIDSVHKPFNGKYEENVFPVAAENKKYYSTDVIDIANDALDPKECADDPTKFRSAKAERGPFAGNWTLGSPIMVCYKLVTLKANISLVGGKVESFLNGYERKLFLKFHKQLVCWMDEWFGKTLEEIRQIEEEAKKNTDAKIAAAAAAANTEKKK